MSLRLKLEVRMVGGSASTGFAFPKEFWGETIFNISDSLTYPTNRFFLFRRVTSFPTQQGTSFFWGGG